MASDSEILENIYANGSKFLLDCYANNENVELINQYHKFIIGNEFDDEITNEYIEELKSSSELWNKLICTDEELQNYILTLIGKINKCDVTDKIKFYNNIFSNEKNVNVLDNDDFWIVQNGKLVMTTLFGDLIETLKCDIDAKVWEKNILDMHKLFLKISRNSKIRERLINWFAEIANVNVRKIELDNYDDDDHYKLSSDNFLFNICGLLHTFFTTFRTKDNIGWLNKIHILYISDNNCKIKWYDKTHTLENKEHNLFTKYFFLLTNILRIFYYPQNARNKKYKYHAEILEQNIRNYSPLSFFSRNTGNLEMMKKHKNITSSNIIMSESIINQNVMKNWINNFTDKLCEWIYAHKPNDFNFDDILGQIILYIKRNIKKNVKSDNHMREIVKNHINLFLDILGTRKYTSNPEIRFNVIDIIMAYCDKLTVDYENGIILDKFIEYIVVFHNDLENYSTEKHINVNKRAKLYEILSVLIKQGKNIIINSLGSIFDNDNLRTKQFIHIALEDYIYIDDHIDSYDEMLSRSGLNPMVNDQIDNFKYLTLINCNVINLFYQFRRIDNFMTEFISKELLMSFCCIITKIINKYVAKYNLIFPFGTRNQHEMNKKFRVMVANLCELIDLICVYCDADYFAHMLITSSIGFDIHNMKKILNVMHSSTLMDFINRCNTVMIKFESNDDIEYPDEYCDPICCVPIIDPILLPDMGDETQFYEKSTIIKHILNKKENPFNRRPLTIDELEKYNNTTENVKKIQKFKYDFEKWKTENSNN